MTRWLIR